MKFWYIILFIAATATITWLDKGPEVSRVDRQWLAKVTQHQQLIDSRLTTNQFQRGTSTFNSGRAMTEDEVNESIDFHFNNKLAVARPMAWSDVDGSTAALSALGLDWRHHFANSFLVGTHPFDVENAWLPLYLIAKFKRYQYDKDQYQALDLWQNSAQAFVLPYGDCEDHAILLADWLISEGLDARVVVGTYNNEGHAWVSVIKDGKEFLLEATSKRVGQSWSHYPLASLAKGYQADMMFNRKTLWINQPKQDASGEQIRQWQKISEFALQPDPV